jgi:hypothetical protein
LSFAIWQSSFDGGKPIFNDIDAEAPVNCAAVLPQALVQKAGPTFLYFRQNGCLAVSERLRNIIEKRQIDSKFSQIEQQTGQAAKVCTQWHSAGPSEDADQPTDEHSEHQTGRPLIGGLLDADFPCRVFHNYGRRIERHAAFAVQVS